MAILSQLLPLIVTIYWSLLTEFFSTCLYANLVERCHNHLLVKLADHLDFQPIEAVCRAYQHSAGAGRNPIYSTAVLVRSLLVMYLYDLSYRQMEQRLCSDLVVRWFVGIGAFGDVPDHTTLDRFDQWVRQHHPRIYFDTVLRQIDAVFPKSRSLNQIGDTYAMLANAAEEDLVTRLRHTVICLLREAVQEMPDLLTLIVSRFEWHTLLGAPQEKPSFCLSKLERQQRLETVILAAKAFHQRFADGLQDQASQTYPDVWMWVGYLGKILHDEVIFLPEPDGDGWWVHLRTAQERRNDPETSLRIGSATDPEATYRMHGEDEEDIRFGYNVQLAAATDGFIRATQAYTGAVPDQAGVAPLIATQIEHQESCPPKLIYDMAAGSGKTRSEVAEVSNGKTKLIAKELPYDNRSARFGPYDFSLSEDGKVLTCPFGKTSDSAYRSGSGDGLNFRFYACQCWLNAMPPKRMKAADLSLRCPLWEDCRDNRQGPGSMRQVFISDYRDHVLEAKVYNQTDAFRVEMKQRPQIERIVFELTHYNGARYCRGRGLEAADWQAKMSATAYDLKLWMRKIDRLALPATT